MPTTTLRYYERRGLLRPDGRTAANYRVYTSRTAERLKFIRLAQANGLSRKDIRETLALTHSGPPPCEGVASLIAHRLADVKQRLDALRRVEQSLATAVASCCRKGGADWCSELQRVMGLTNREFLSVLKGNEPAGTRTRDPVIKSHMLYQLSYRLKRVGGEGTV